MAHKARLVVVISVLIALSGCFEDNYNNDYGSGRPPGDDGEGPPPPPTSENNAPTISGVPAAFVVEGEVYEFTPTAQDADGDELAFSIIRKPSWADFDRTTGRLWGTPTAQDVGSFTNIGISVSDGEDSTALAAFNVTVDQIALGAATLSWNPPTQNYDGSQLTNLVGYRIYYGTDLNVLGRIVTVDNPGLTRYVIENLRPARWYFTMTSVNSDGVESSRSALISMTIS